MTTSTRRALFCICRVVVAWTLLTMMFIAHAEQKASPQFWDRADSKARAILDAAFDEFSNPVFLRLEQRHDALWLLRGGKSEAKPSAQLTRSLERREDTKRAKSEPQKPFKPDPTKPYAHPFYWAPFILMGNWL